MPFSDSGSLQRSNDGGGRRRDIITGITKKNAAIKRGNVQFGAQKRVFGMAEVQCSLQTKTKNIYIEEDIHHSVTQILGTFISYFQ